MNLSKPTDNTAPRRTQFSSCDGCRGSRLACDAARIGIEPGNPGESGSCSRCVRRGQKCTFEWIKNVKRPTTKPRRNSRAVVPVTPGYSQASSSSPESQSTAQTTLTTMSEPRLQRTIEYLRDQPSGSPGSIPVSTLVNPRPCPSEDAMTLVGDWLEKIFETFETVFGFWIGRHCCPLVADTDSDIFVYPTRLVATLDVCIADGWEVRKLDAGFSLSASRQDKDRQIDQSLRHAIRSFSSRWLHLVPRIEELVPSHEEIVRELWRTSRNDLLKVINRVSYRSALILFLFGQTPIPVGISEEEEMDGLTGQICVQTALQHVQRLRERQRNYEFNGTKVSLRSDVYPSPAAPATPTRRFLSAESRAYWGALIFDTNASLTLNFRSSLTSGLHGVSTESSWRALKSGAGSFHTRTEDWRRGTVHLTDDMVVEVIAAAGAGNVYLLKMIAVLKEALREGYEEDKVAEAWAWCLEAMDMFKVTFGPLLDLCAHRLPFLGQVERLNWYELMLHHHLGILLLVDGVEAAERSDLLSQLIQAQRHAERELLHTIGFGLENYYTIQGPPSAGAATASVPAGSPPVLRASLIAIDPYPHHLVAAIQLMDKAVGREYKQDRIKLDGYKRLKSTLLRALEESPQVSKSVDAARRELYSSFAELEMLGDKSISPEAVRWQSRSGAA